MVPRILVAALVVLCAQGSQDTSGADVDGPYVFEAEGGAWIAHSIVRKDSALTVRKDPVQDSTIQVPLPGREKPLRVTLRPTGAPPPTTVPIPDRIMALSDIEGNFEALVRLLRAGGVVDDDLTWTFGRGHLVYVGDIFDRGLHVTECLWLLYELEARALAAGGRVHFVLGNHEVMNLTGDLRYVRKKYRENAALLEEKLEALYARRTVLGRWLRMKNAVLRIGDEIFVHGGISPGAAKSKLTLQELNDALRNALLADAREKPKEDVLKWAVDGKEGLIWYRGYLKDPIDEKTMTAILAAYGATRVVVGHTLVAEVGFTLGGKVLALDVPHAGGVSQAAISEKGEWSRLSADGTRERLTPR